MNRHGPERGGAILSNISHAITEGMYRAYEGRLLKDISKGPVPQHVAIIMDGNRRFAELIGKDPKAGHQYGKEKLEEVLEWCLEVRIKVLTVFAFSTENIRRTDEEVTKLMELFAENFRAAGDDERVHRHKIRITAIGQLELLPETVQEAIRYAEGRTKGHDCYRFNIAVAYGGRQEIVQAIKQIAKEHKDGTLGLDEIDERTVSKYLYTHDLPDPDLILRTSGEERISNFLIWQMAYSELYFSDVYWPGFRKVDFLRAVRTFQMRQRRQGK